MVIRKKKIDRLPEALDPFSAYFSVGEAITTLLHPFAEVVLHDLRTGRIVRIWNSFSERQAGDLSNLKGAKDAFPENQSILGPYEKAMVSQGRTKSITAGLRTPENELIGFLCINLDVSVLDTATAMLTSFASTELKRPEPIYRNDLQQHISYLVRDYSLRVNKPIELLTRAERAELVGLVDRDGLFQARNSVMHVANAMKVSRATIYNLLNEINKGTDDASAEPDTGGSDGGLPKTPKRRATAGSA